MNLYIVRHGNPDYSNDVLTELGHKQAEAAAKALVNLNIDEIYASSMGRAKETAQHLCNLIGKDMTIEPWAAEVEHYSNTPDGGLTRTVQLDPTFLRSPELEALGNDWASHPMFRGEKEARAFVDTVERGAEDFMERLGYKLEGNRFKVVAPNEKNVALFCHAGVFLVLTSFLLRIPQLTAWHSLFMYQGSVTWCNVHNYDSGYTVPRYLYVNDTHHIREAGLPLT